MTTLNELLTLEAMRRRGWCESNIEVARLNFEYENILLADRTAREIHDYGLRMVTANNGSYILNDGTLIPEPGQQFLQSSVEHNLGLPHVFYPWKQRRSDARAYSRDVRNRIYGNATAAAARMRRDLAMKEKPALKKIAAILTKHNFASATGLYDGKTAGLRKLCRLAETGRAEFQACHDFAMRFHVTPQRDSDPRATVKCLMPAGCAIRSVN